jgi:hypothetical protein
MGQDSTEVKIDDLLYHVTSIVQKQKKEVNTWKLLIQRTIMMSFFGKKILFNSDLLEDTFLNTRRNTSYTLLCKYVLEQRNAFLYV